MKHLICIAILLILIPTLVKAQGDYKQSYIVNLKNETITGFIEYKEGRNNPKSFNFKNAPDAQPQKLDVSKVKVFTIRGIASYEMFVAKISRGIVSGVPLPVTPDTTYDVDSVFLKVITKGKNVSLYSYKDDKKTRYYMVSSQDNQVKELDYFAYSSSLDQSASFVSSYRRQLLTIAYPFVKNAPNVVKDINAASYDETSLLKVTRALNGDDQVTYEVQSGVRLFLGASARINKLTFSDTQMPFPPGTSTNANALAPAASFGIDYVANKRTRKLVLRAELMIAANRYNFSNVSVDTKGSTASLDVKQLNALLMPQIIYNFYTGANLMAFVSGGIGVNYSTYNDYVFYGNYPSAAVPNVVTNKYPTFEKVSFTIPLKLGVVVNNHIELSGAYYYPTVLVNTDRSYAKASAIQFGVNYLFGK